MSLVNEKTGRDLVEFRRCFQAWIENQFQDKKISITDVSALKNNGFSNETLIVSTINDGSSEDFVVRIPPPSESRLFPEYNFRLQAYIQNHLVSCGIPAPRTMAFEENLKWIGAPFLVMPRIDGRVPPDVPNYAQEGWVKQLPLKDQRKVFDNYFSNMAKVHNLEIEESGVREVVARSMPMASDLRREWQWWLDYLYWQMDAAESDNLYKVKVLFDWCEAHWPSIEPPSCLLWGDARPGNVIYDENLNAAALLDFELAAIGPAEVDIGWWMASRHNEFSVDGRELPELPGLPDREQSLSLYSNYLGRPLMDMEWYEVFGAARVGASICGLQTMAVKRGLPQFPMSAVSPWIAETQKTYLSR